MIHWARAHSLSIAYILIVSFFATALFAVQREADDRRAEDQRAAQSVTAELCHTVNDQQAVLSDLIELVTSREGSSLPLTSVPEFQRLDTDTQAWVMAFLAGAKQGPNLDAELEQFAAQRLVPADCRRR
jgi:hypothetical protein